MSKKKHYATLYKERIADLESVVYDYYDAIYDVKMAIHDRNGLKARPVHCGRARTISNEEGPPIRTFEGACKIIEGLPLRC